MKNKLTALIVSFYRYEYLEKCVESLRYMYPDINIIVGNNGPEDKRKEKLCKKYNAEYYKLPYNCGICVGRNMLVKKIKTPFTLIGDDDFYYDKHAQVDEMLKMVETFDMDLLGGRIYEGGLLKNYQGFIHDHGNWLKYERLSPEWIKANPQKSVRVDITFNYFVAKTAMLKDVKWDEKIKVAYEHSAFFIDAKRKKYQVWFNPSPIVIHKPPIIKKDNKEYEKYRFYRNRKNDKKRFFEKFGIDYVIDMSGRKDVFDGTGMDEIDFMITVFERWEHLERLLFSIAKYCPNANISIADQSKKFYAKKYLEFYNRLAEAGLKNKPKAYNMPYDCGLSYSRNYLNEITHRKYKLLLEEDFVFTEKTNIKKMMEIMEADQKIGAVGGMVLENGCPVDFANEIVIDSKWRKMTVKFVEPTRELKGDKTKYLEVSTVPNFTLFKAECLDQVKWDNNIKIHGEHTDFYLSWAKECRHKIVYAPEIQIDHDKSEQSRLYKEMRKRKEFLKYMFEKNNINKLIYKNGQTIELKDGEFVNYRTNVK